MAAQVWIRAGASQETPETSGAAHFLEHMIFKGTAKRDGVAIARFVESRGGIINASTSHDFTNFYIVLPKEYISSGLEILAETLSSAIFPPNELERERRVVLEEIKRRNDNPSSYAQEQLARHLYKTAPYGKPVIGSSITLTSMRREDLVSFYKRHYHPRQAILVISGDIQPQEALRLARSHFEKIPTGEPFEPPKISETSPGSGTLRIQRPVTKTYLLLAFLGPDIQSPDQYPLDVLASLLGQGSASRLVRSLREEKQIVFDVGAHFETEKGPGTFVLWAHAKKEELPEIQSEISGEIARLTVEEPTTEEISRAKMKLRAARLFEEETAAGLAFGLGLAETFYQKEYFEEYLLRIEKVTAQDIRRVAKKYLQADPAVVIMEPEEK